MLCLLDGAERRLQLQAKLNAVCHDLGQTGALQVWRNAKKNRKTAIAKYRAGESLGWTRPLPELFRAAGLKFDFGEKTIGPLIKTALEDLEKLDG